MNPFCGESLQTGTKLIAILHLVFSILGVVFGILALSGVAMVTSAIQNDRTYLTNVEALIVAVYVTFASIDGVVIIVAGILLIPLSTLLLSGANKRNQTMCMTWFVLQTIFLLLGLLGTLRTIFSEGHNDAATIGGCTFGILVHTYFLWVVWAFMSEMKEGVEVEFKILKEGEGGSKMRV